MCAAVTIFRTTVASCGDGPQPAHDGRRGGRRRGFVKKRLMTAIAAVALMAVMLPGVASASAGGNSAAAKDCQENYAAYAFRNHGQCTGFLARGGTLDDTFESHCLGLPGTYTGGTDSLTEKCDFDAPKWSDFRKALVAFQSLCRGGEIAWIWDTTSGESAVLCIR
jgi:hypothetical protein